MVYIIIVTNIIVTVGIFFLIFKERKENEGDLVLRVNRLKMLRIFSSTILLLLIIFSLFIGIAKFGVDDFLYGMEKSLDIVVNDEIREKYEHYIPDHTWGYRQSEIGQITRCIIANILEIPIFIGIISYAIVENKKIIDSRIEWNEKE